MCGIPPNDLPTAMSPLVRAPTHQWCASGRRSQGSWRGPQAETRTTTSGRRARARWLPSEPPRTSTRRGRLETVDCRPKVRRGLLHTSEYAHAQKSPTVSPGNPMTGACGFNILCLISCAYQSAVRNAGYPRPMVGSACCGVNSGRVLGGLHGTQASRGAEEQGEHPVHGLSPVASRVTPPFRVGGHSRPEAAGAPRNASEQGSGGAGGAPCPRVVTRG
jgi:hypothetical protein